MTKKPTNIIRSNLFRQPKTGEQWRFKESDPFNSQFSIMGIENKNTEDPLVWFQSNKYETYYKQPLSVFLNLYIKIDEE